MFLLDLENLNILVLFILSFIAFKGYQADNHILDSQSEQELSQQQNISSEKPQDKVNTKSTQLDSQQVQNDQPHTQMLRQEPNVTQQVLFSMTNNNQEIKNDQINPFLTEQVLKVQKIQQSSNQPQIFIQIVHQQIEKQKIEQKCEQQNFQSCSYSSNSEQNSQLDSVNDDDQSEKNPQSVQKIKKIKKIAKKMKRDLKKDEERLEELKEQISIQ